MSAGWTRAGGVLLLLVASLSWANKAPLVFGSDHDFPPYEWLDARGKPQGFNVELIQAIGRAIDREVTVKLGPWDEIRAELEQAGTVDVADMYFHEARLAAVSFSEPFQVANDELFVRRGEPAACSERDLGGKRVLVEKSAYAEEYLLSEHPLAVPLAARSEPRALLRLAAGEGDCALVSQYTGRYTVEQRGLSNLVVASPPLNQRPYAFVVKKGREDLLTELNRGLAVVRATGRYDELHQEYFGQLQGRGALGDRLVRTVQVALLPLLALVLGGVAWTWSLRRKVRERTRELAESEQRLSRLIERAPEAIFVIEPGTYALTQVNAQARQLLWSGGPPPGGSTVDSVFSAPATREAFKAGIARALGNDEPIFECELPTPGTDGVACEVRLVSLPSARGPLVRASLIDVSARRALQRRLAAGERMEAIGRLAGGVAHDFNNLLTVVMTDASLLVRRLPPGEDRDCAQDVVESAERAAALTRQLLLFSRQQLSLPSRVAPAARLKAMRSLLGTLLGDDVTLTLEAGDDVGAVLIDPAQLEQVVLNLCSNARDAMPSGGALRVSVARQRVETGELPDVPAGDYVVLEVADTGEGIAPEVMPRIFEPFFSTRDELRNTGLGLATVFGITRQAKGHLTVVSQPGQGATFRVWLPRLEEPAATGARAATPAIAAPPPLRVLLVDDEAPLRRVLQRLLAAAGHVVTEAESAAAARQAFGDGGTFDVLLTDVMMPGENGRSLGEGLQALRPGLKVLLMTGHAEDATLREGALAKDTLLLLKPFTADQLTEALGRLTAPATPPAPVSS